MAWHLRAGSTVAGSTVAGSTVAGSTGSRGSLHGWEDAVGQTSMACHGMACHGMDSIGIEEGVERQNKKQRKE